MKIKNSLNDVGLLLLRLGFGLTMAFAHGWGKVQKFLTEDTTQWADPIGIGSSMSLFLAGFTELFLSLALVIGLFTRIVTIPLAFTMIVAAFIVHIDDPFSKMEMALLYLVVYLCLFFTGAGKFSVDALIRKRRN